MRESAVRFAGSGGAKLAGTLLLPSGRGSAKMPGVLLVAGSGPTDRDGNSHLMPRKVDTLKLIAERLAEVRIASLRFDKRGVGASTHRPPTVEERMRFFRWDNAIGDVRSAYAELLRHREIDAARTALLGHSIGGVLMLAAAKDMGNRPRALVFAATPGRPLREIIRRQVARQFPRLVPKVRQAIKAIGKTGRSPRYTGLRNLFPPYAGRFLQQALVFDPARAAAGIGGQCLLIHGAADRLVVPMDDIQPLVDVLGGPCCQAEILVAPGVGHYLLSPHPTQEHSNRLRLAPAVSHKLTSWLSKTLE